MTTRNLLAAALISAFLCEPVCAKAPVPSGFESGPGAVSSPRGEPLQKKSSKQSKESAEDYYQKGVIALRYGLTDEAIRYGNLGLALDPNHFNTLNLLGSAYYTKREYAKSAASYERAVQISPETAEVHRNLGLACLETEEMDKAEAAFRKAVELSGDADASFYLSRLLYNLGRHEEALEYILKTIQKNSKSATAYNLKGVILNQMGRYKEASGSFQAGLVLDPEDVGLMINLGISYINTGEPAKAKAVLQKALPLIEEAALKARVEEYLKSIDK
jgi:tetratricopeptide (TPR) repeat protein